MQNVAIFGVPRSGTSWLGQLFNSSEKVVYRYQPIFSYSFKSSISATSTSDDITKFHEELLLTTDPFVCQSKNVSGKDTPTFIKEKPTHLVWKEVRFIEIIENLIKKSDTRIVGIIRHPCGVLKSWISAPREFDKNWNLENEWESAKSKNLSNSEYYGYQKWVEASQYLIELSEKYPSRVTLVSYEYLLTNTYQELQRLFDFLSIEYSKQVDEFISISTSTHSDDPYDIFRKDKKIDEWKDILPSHIINKIINDHNYITVKEFFENH